MESISDISWMRPGSTRKSAVYWSNPRLLLQSLKNATEVNLLVMNRKRIQETKAFHWMNARGGFAGTQIGGDLFCPQVPGPKHPSGGSRLRLVPGAAREHLSHLAPPPLAGAKAKYHSGSHGSSSSSQSCSGTCKSRISLKASSSRSGVSSRLLVLILQFSRSSLHRLVNSPIQSYRQVIPRLEFKQTTCASV